MTTFLSQRPPSCSSDYLPALAATSPAPATTFLLQQLTSCTSDYLPAAAATSPTTAATSPAPVITSSDYQQLPDLHQQSSPAPAMSSCNNYQFLDFMNRHLPYDILITFCHNKIWPFENNHLVSSFLPCSLSITYISKVYGIDIFIGPATSCKSLTFIKEKKNVTFCFLCKHFSFSTSYYCLFKLFIQWLIMKDFSLKLDGTIFNNLKFFLT